MIDPTGPARAMLSPRGRVAGVIVLLVLVFALFAYHYLQNSTSFNSDHLYTVHFCDDVLHGRDVRGWHLPAAPYLVPDMVLVLACLAVTSNITAVFVLYAACYYALLLAAMTALFRGAGMGRRNAFLAAGLGMVLLLTTLTDPAFVSRSLLLFHPGNHMGCFLVGLGVTALVVRALRVGYGWFSAGLLVVVCAVCGTSDQLLIVQFLAPVGAVALLLGLCRLVPRRRGLLTVALLLVSVWAATHGRVVLVKCGFVPMRLTNLDAGLFKADVPGTLGRFAEGLWSVTDGQPPMWAAFLLHVALGAGAVVVWIRRAARPATDAPTANEDRPEPAAVLFLSLVLLLAPFSSAAALVITGTVEPAALLRYLYPICVLPFLCLTLWPHLLPWRPVRLLPWAAVVFIAFRLVTFPDELRADRFAHRYPPLAQTLDELARKHGPVRGFAEYWRAREAAYLTREKVQVLPILSWGMPWFHGYNPNAFLSDDPHDLTIPDYHFIVFPTDDQPGPDRQQMLTRYGEPEEILRGEGYEVWRYERLASRRLELFLRAQLAQRLVRHRPFVGPSEPASLARPKANLSPWTARGNILYPRDQVVTLRFDRPARGALVDVGAHFGDEYVLTFLRGGKELGTTRVPAVDWTGAEIAYCLPGMQSRLVPVPAACRSDGFDEVRVTPAGAQDWYVLGHFLVFDEWIPYKPAAKRPDRHRHRYEGENMQGQGTDSPEVTTVVDPSASAGRARQASASFQGYLAYGPYVPLAPGRYRVEFSLRIEDNQSADVVATIDGTAFGGRQLLNSRPLRGVDFGPAGQYGRFDFTFESDEELELVEFRVNSHGKTAVVLDYVEMTRMSEPAAAARR